MDLSALSSNHTSQINMHSEQTYLTGSEGPGSAAITLQILLELV